MKTRKIVCLLLALVLIGLLAACGSTGTSTTTAGTTAAATVASTTAASTTAAGTTAAATANKEQTEITNGSAAMWLNTGIEPETVIQILNTDWNKSQKFTIAAQIQPGSPDDYFQKLTVAFASNSGPDIFMMSANEIVKYVDSGIAYDMSKWILPNKDDYYENCIKAVTFNGKIMATPSNMDLLGLYYNKDLFDQMGLKPPTTWQETIDTAKKLATSDRYGMLIDTVESGYANFEFYPYIWMNGGDLLSADHKSVTVNDSSAKALQFYRDLINSGAVCKKVPSETYDTTLLATGKVGMQVCGSWAVAELKQKHPDFKYGVVPYPVPQSGMKSSSDAGGWRFMVSSKGKDPSNCADFLDWMLNKDTKYPLQICEASAKFSPRKSVIAAAGDYYQQAPLNVFSNDILPIASMEPAYNNTQVKIIGDAMQAAMFTDQPISKIVDDLKNNMTKSLE